MSTDTSGTDPDADPEMLAGGRDTPDTSGGIDGVREATPVQDDPEDDDDPDADPEMLSSTS